MAPIPNEVCYTSMIFAPSGSGKTVLILFLAAQAIARYRKLKVYGFDIKRGMEVFSKVIDGKYLMLNVDKLDLNPFDIPNKSLYVQNLTSFLKTIAGISVNNTEYEEIIQESIQNSFSLEKTTFKKTWYKAIPQSKFKDLLRPFADGKYKEIFHGIHDSFNIANSQFMASGMDEVIKDENLFRVLISYFLTKIQNHCETNSVPSLMIVDESATLLQDKFFAEQIQQYIRTIRKSNGVLNLIFQEVSGLTNLGKTSNSLITNTQTFIFFPRTSDNPEELDKFKLTETEKEFVLGNFEIRGAVRPILIKRQDEEYTQSTFIDINLIGLGNALKTFEGGAEAVKKVNMLKELNPESWQQQYI